MVRSLLIRRLFMLLDTALAAGAVYTLGMVVYHSFDGPAAIDAGPVSGAEGRVAVALNEVGQRETYSAIETLGLFGQAGAKTADAPLPPVVDDTPAEQTSLNLRLVGTSAVAEADALATAIIEDSDQKVVLTYAIGDAIREKVTLKSVRQREVVIVNGMVEPPKEELLSMEVGDGDAPPVSAAAPLEASAQNQRAERITLNRNEIVEDIYASYTDLITKVKPEMYRDATGKVVGVTADNIAEIPLAKKLGLSDGDVLQTVNNETIDSEQKIMEIVQKYRNAGSFRIGVLRGGKPKVITYRLE